MSLISMFFMQTAVISPFVREASGEAVYGDSEIRACRLERGKHLQNTGAASGTVDQTVANAKMFCEGPAIPERSMVVCDGQEFTVINCEIKNGFRDHHLEVYLE